MTIMPVKDKILAIAGQGIGADPDKLKSYALTYAKGQTRANGIVLLYGAGEVRGRTCWAISGWRYPPPCSQNIWRPSGSPCLRRADDASRRLGACARSTA
jgi:hypothetical protein